MMFSNVFKASLNDDDVSKMLQKYDRRNISDMISITEAATQSSSSGDEEFKRVLEARHGRLKTWTIGMSVFNMIHLGGTLW